jgi:hypothetical protein
LISEAVYKAGRTTATYGIVVTGNYDSSTELEFAEQLNIHDNIIVDAVTGGIRAGTTSGAVRDLSIHHNYIHLRQTAHVDVIPRGILLSDQGTTAMRTVRVNVNHNTISLDGSAGIGIDYKPVDNSANSYIRIFDNFIRQCATNVVVTEQTGSTDITQDYMPSSMLSAVPTLDLLSANAVGLTGWAAASLSTASATTLLLTQGLNSVNPTSAWVVTDVVVSGINHGTPLLYIRNAASSTANTVTFTYDAAKIRTQPRADVVVNSHGAIQLIPITTALVQQVG